LICDLQVDLVLVGDAAGRIDDFGGHLNAAPDQSIIEEASLSAETATEADHDRFGSGSKARTHGAGPESSYCLDQKRLSTDVPTPSIQRPRGQGVTAHDCRIGVISCATIAVDQTF
jgi:hypothetical protein